MAPSSMPRRTLPPELLALLQGGLESVPDPLPGLLKRARKLPVDGQAVWLLLTHQLAAPGLEERPPTLVLLINISTGALLYQDLLEDADTADLTGLVLEAMLEPRPATRDGGGLTLRVSTGPAARPVRPARLLASDAYVAQSLAAELAPLKVAVTHDRSPETAQMLAALAGPFQAALSAQVEAMRAHPVLTGRTDEAVRAFHAAMSAFLAAEPWEVFDPLKLIRAIWTDEQGQARQCCASVMGGEGESFGLALYARADEWAVLAQSADPLIALRVLSGMERVSLGDAAELAAEDRATFERLDLQPMAHDGGSGWPVLQRLTRNDAPGADVGVQTVASVTPLPVVTALLQTLADRARARPGRQVVSLTAELGGVRVRYPSPPADDFSEQQRRGAVRVTIEGMSAWVPSATEPLTVTAPASMTLRDVWSAAQKQHGRLRLPFSLEFPQAGEQEEGELFASLPAELWHSRSGAPLLIMRHLPDAGPLDGGGQTVRAEWLPELEVGGVDLKILNAGQADTVSAVPTELPLISESVGKKVARKSAPPRKRPQHQGMCRLCGFVGNKASMTRHLTKCEGRAGTGKGEQEVYRLRVSGSPEYWLDVEMPLTANLDDLDGFLRGIWLECCGHMSAFSIGPQENHDDFDPFRPPKKSRQPALSKLELDGGDRFGYTYDFGSSTELTVQVQARETVAGVILEPRKIKSATVSPVSPSISNEVMRPEAMILVF